MEMKIDQTGRHIKIELEGVDITKGTRNAEIHIDPLRGTAHVLLNLEVDELEIFSLAERDHTIMVSVTSAAEQALQAIGWVKTSNRDTYTYPREDSNL